MEKVPEAVLEVIARMVCRADGTDPDLRVDGGPGHPAPGYHLAWTDYANMIRSALGAARTLGWELRRVDTREKLEERAHKEMYGRNSGAPLRGE